MNKNEATAYLSIMFPGQPADKAALEMVKLFMTPLNSFVAAISNSKNFSLWTAPNGKKISVSSYPKNNPAEVAIRAVACCTKYPQASLAYAQSRKLDAIDVDSETGEPITIMLVIGIIVALAPVILPLVMGLVDSFIKGDAANKATESKAATDAAKIAADEKKTKMIAMVAGGVLVAVIIVIAVRRLA